MEPRAEAALVMAGGRGERLGGAVKPLITVCGRRLIDYALEAAWEAARLALIAVSPHTQAHLASAGYCEAPAASCLYTPGHGYPEDLSQALRVVAARPLLVLPADAAGPLARAARALLHAAARHGWGAGVYTLTCGGRPLGVSLFTPQPASRWLDVEHPAACGVVNVNTPRDLEEARARCTRP